MRFGSVCSGIEAASVAWEPLGWRPQWFAEIAPFPSAVLAHRWPGVPNHGDFTQIGGAAAAIDLLVGGTPCQSFSVAGLRGGMADSRGNLALEFLRLAQRTRPRWVVWENVPGVLSSNGGRDLGSILGGLAELGYGFAYRVLDAQFFGLAQRRKRVFVVGHLGDWRRAAAVLFERASLRGDSAPRREAGARTAGTLESSAGNGRGWRVGADEAASEDGTGRGVPLVPVAFHATQDPISGDVSPALAAKSTIGVMALQSVNTPRERAQNGIGISDDVSMYTLTKRDQHAVAVFDEAQITSKTNRSKVTPGAPSPTLNADSRLHLVSQGVRRLTPRECERLQGFPDDHTLIPWRKGMASDGPRIQALGNSMAVPVMRWIGERIVKADALPSSALEAA